MTTTLRLPRATPESQGVSATAISAFIEAAEREGCGLNSLMLLRRGHVVAEGWWKPYAPGRTHMLFSLSKSFTSTAVGLAMAEGFLTLDDPVLSFFSNDLPKRIGRRWPEVKVRHLLSMSTGHLKDTMERIRQRRQTNWVRGILEQAIRREPGTHFVYNNGASYLLAAIIHRVTGMNVREYLQPRLFAPLGIEDPTWESCPRGINCGGWGLNLKTEDIARFGQLYLQKGLWNGAQLLPESWVDIATSVQVSNGDDPNSDWAQGYGFQFWRCRHGAYRGDGAFGQFCIVMPDQEAVLAMTGSMVNMQLTLDKVWEHLLPGFAAAPLPEKPTAQKRLESTLSTVAHTPQAGAMDSPVAAVVSGSTYAMAPNPLGIETLSCTFEGHHCRLGIRDRRGSHEVKVGYGAWLYGMSDLPAETRVPIPVAASGAWVAPDSYVAQLRYYETPFCSTLSLHFDGDGVTCSIKANVAFGPTEGPMLTGNRING